MENNTSISQFFITEKNYEYKNKKVYQDKNDIIRATLLKHKFACGNYIIIHPNGNFYQKLREYKQDEIAQNLINFEYKSSLL